MLRLRLSLAVLTLVPTIALAQMAAAPFEGRLKKIQETKTISVAYRTDALPFSFEDDDKKPAGYTVDLCRSVIGVDRAPDRRVAAAGQVGAGDVQTRFTAISSGQADMECGATTVTLGRMKEVDFSSLTFVDGTGLLIRASTAGKSLTDLGNKKIGVIAGTSNERALAEAMKAKVVTATVVTVKTREEGLAQLEAGTIDAFASDRVLLVGLAGKAKDPKALALAGRFAVVRALRHHAAARRLGDAAGGRFGAVADLQQQRAARNLQPLVRRLGPGGADLESCSRWAACRNRQGASTRARRNAQARRLVPPFLERGGGVRFTSRKSADS